MLSKTFVVIFLLSLSKNHATAIIPVSKNWLNNNFNKIFCQSVKTFPKTIKTIANTVLTNITIRQNFSILIEVMSTFTPHIIHMGMD